MELVLGLQLEEMARFPNQQRTLISRVSLALHWPSAKITSFFKVHNSILHIFLIIFHELKKKKKKREKRIMLLLTLFNYYSFMLSRRNISCIFQCKH